MSSVEPPIPSQSLPRWRTLVRALGHRNYKLFFLGQGTSLIGTWVQRTALAWLVYRMTGSEWLLGVVGFAGSILTFLVAPFAGVLADRVNRRGALILTQVLAMVQAFALGALALSGAIEVWHIIALAAVMGLINAFDIPIRQSFVVEMLEKKDDLPNAIALNSFLVNAAKLVGPVLAGWLIYVLSPAQTAAASENYRALGEGRAFLINGATFLAVVAALLAMRVRPGPPRPPRRGILHTLREGLNYSMGFAPIRAILLLLALTSLLGTPYTVLLPVFAKDIFHGGPATLGFLTAATGLGALAGGVLLAWRTSARGLGRIMAAASVLFAAALALFALSANLYLSLSLLVVVGFAFMIQMVASNTLLQTIVDDDKRGRVMSLYTVCFMGMMPFGSLLSGWLAHWLGAPGAVLVGAGGCAAAGIAFALRLPALGRATHPIYIQKGLIAPDGPGTQPLQHRL
ncbi:MAG: MFS transporter [Planctomycetaceae bacterium]|nr:MFS transporter [Planctomycetaceae bacterium]